MIGVLSLENERESVKEFFELFKTPWEFFSKDSRYDVILTTQDPIPDCDAKLIIVFGSTKRQFDGFKKVRVKDTFQNVFVEYKDTKIPIYGSVLSFEGDLQPILKVEGRPEIVGLTFEDSVKKIAFIGYDLFKEVQHLLTIGQPLENALFPALELHISLIRDLILQSKIAFVEIPPIPAGYDYITCLTHDVDFMGIRDHKFDRSALGFMSRVFFPYSMRDQGSKICWSKPIRNMKALLALPGVYIGLLKDFWFQLDHYIEIEGNIPSTFFFISVKDNPGDKDLSDSKPKEYRAAKYDVRDYKTSIHKLIQKGCEIGVHGIDAWHCPKRGQQELQTIRRITDEGKPLGIRMHWLYFSESSPKILEEAGFLYDSTLGYNNGVGYQCGTTQIFRLPGSLGLFELPLHIQDTSMFLKARMNLSQKKAMQLCENVIKDIRKYGGVLTVNWHQRSLGPERNWDDFYIELMNKFRADKPWFTTARQAVLWFKKRRSVQFNEIQEVGDKIGIKVTSEDDTELPGLLMRVHHRKVDSTDSKKMVGSEKSYVDIPWSGMLEHLFSC